MYSFFILGIIPGTNITITFSMWLMLAALAASVTFGRYKLRGTKVGDTKNWPSNSVLLPL